MNFNSEFIHKRVPELPDLHESILVPAKFHPLRDEVTLQVNNYFLDHWPFPDGRARIKFVKAGFPGVTCAYFPLALDDRIQFACQLLTLLFLVDGEFNMRVRPIREF